MENAKKKSLARKKKTFFTIAQTLTKEGCSVLIPGGGLAFDAIMALVNHAKEFRKDRMEIRLHEFHEYLLNPTNNDYDIKGFIDKPILLDDYYSLLTSAIQDDEDNKVPLYANLLRSFATNRIPPKYKLHFLKAAKELSFEEAEFIRRIYISSRYDLMTPGGPSTQVSSLMSIGSSINVIIKQNLWRLGFLSQEDAEYKPTELMPLAAEALYNPEDLQPSSIGKKQWCGLRFMIISNQLSSHDDITFCIDELLWKKGIKSSMVTLCERNLNKAERIYDYFILMLDSHPISDSQRDALAIVSPKIILKILLPEKNTPAVDPLPQIEADNIVQLRGDWSADKKRIENIIMQYIKIDN